MRKSTLFAGSTMFAVAIAAAAPSFAQDAAGGSAAPVCTDPNAAGCTPTVATTTAATEDGAIVVVGSRIRRDNYNSASPIQVVTRDETTAAGFNSTTEALQGTAVSGGSSQINNAYGGFVTNGGPGANTLSLRGLGATRTLIMLNGRRIAPAGSRGSVGSADLNVLPSAMVDRIEILKDGASSIYGSDAIAGVVNLVTRQNIDGLTFEGQQNFTGEGGGETQRFSLVYGITGDRFNLSASAEFTQRSDLNLGERDWTACQTSYRLSAAGAAPDSGSFIDPTTGLPKCYPLGVTGENGVTINTIGTSSVAARPAAGAVTATFNRLRPNAAVTTGVVGYEGVGGGANNLNVRDTFAPAMLRQSLISPAKIYTGFVQASYDLGVLGDAEAYTEVLYNRRESSQVSYRQLVLDYARLNPLIPANLAFSTFSPVASSVSNGLPIGVRAFIGFGNTNNSQVVNFTKVSGGVRGNFLFDGWRYDLFGSSTWSDASYDTETFLTSRIAQSMDVVSDGLGGFVCRNTANGCVA
ncbi:MAG: TonB-dependent receptor, partial [Sphingopyxis sp.]